MRRRWVVAAAVVLAVLVGAVVAAALLIDEPLRRYIQARMNQRLDGYTVRIGKLDFHPLGFSIDFEDLQLTQDAHPDPPVAHFVRITTSVHWKALLRGRVVGDFEVDRPTFHINLAHIRREAADERPVTKRGWQDALAAMYPLKINEVTVRQGELTYLDEGSFKPLRVSRLNAIATNIRNILSRERVYPSELRLETAVFESGRLTLDGHADFLAAPHPGVLAVVRLDGIELDYFKPILARYHLALRKGTLSAVADLEYAPTLKAAHLSEAVVRDLDADYVHRAASAASVKRAAQKTGRAAEAALNKPGLEIRVDRLQIVNANVGFVNQAAPVEYRVFLADTDLDLRNLSNHLTDGVATARLKGKFMGSGRTLVTASFRPEVSGPDFDVNVRIEDTEMTAMNDLLRTYGRFDVTAGLFSLYAELMVKNRMITGYVKPLFRNLDVYDREQDKHKGVLRKTYERVVGGVSKLLENRPRDEVATKVEISGRLEDPQASTIQVIVQLVQNAFFKAILPGFEREVGKGRRR
jgi:uncharacterized protein DUF748